MAVAAEAKVLPDELAVYRVLLCVAAAETCVIHQETQQEFPRQSCSNRRPFKETEMLESRIDT